jgi:hypothetical protein
LAFVDEPQLHNNFSHFRTAAAFFGYFFGLQQKSDKNFTAHASSEKRLLKI